MPGPSTKGGCSYLYVWPVTKHSVSQIMVKPKAAYKFLGREAWSQKSDDGKLFFALFEEKIVDGVRHASPLCPIRNNFDAVVKYILQYVPELNILQYSDSSIRTALRRLKTQALGSSSDTRADEIVGLEPSQVAQQAATAAVAASGIRTPSPARHSRPSTPAPRSTASTDIPNNSPADTNTPMSSMRCKLS